MNFVALEDPSYDIAERITKRSTKLVKPNFKNMPIGEIETHPYIQQGQLEGATKLILGSFPIYDCTAPDNPKKIENRRNGSVPFFYGSIKSRMWSLYHEFIDNDIIVPPNPEQILESLAIRNIALSDTILECQRHEFSSEDTKLISRVYNRQGLRFLIQNGVRKIICTSKGVLKDLENQIILHGNNNFGQVDIDASLNFQNNFITELGGNTNQITGPISRIFIIGNIHVTALAIPSPGSPQRQLRSFGFAENNWEEYANSYFQNAFEWLMANE